eukprot:54971_1
MSLMLELLKKDKISDKMEQDYDEIEDEHKEWNCENRRNVYKCIDLDSTQYIPMITPLFHLIFYNGSSDDECCVVNLSMGNKLVNKTPNILRGMRMQKMHAMNNNECIFIFYGNKWIEFEVIQLHQQVNEDDLKSRKDELEEEVEYVTWKEFENIERLKKIIMEFLYPKVLLDCIEN